MWGSQSDSCRKPTSGSSPRKMPSLDSHIRRRYNRRHSELNPVKFPGFRRIKGNIQYVYLEWFDIDSSFVLLLDRLNYRLNDEIGHMIHVSSALDKIQVQARESR